MMRIPGGWRGTSPWASVILAVVLCLSTGCDGGDVAPATAKRIDMLESWDLAGRQRGARELVENPDAAAVPALIDALDDDDVLVREYAAEALGRVGDSRAIDGLTALLKDESPDVRWRAAEALGAIGGNSFRPLLDGVMSDDIERRRNAAGAMAQVDGMKAVAPVLAVLQGADFAGDPAMEAGVGSLGAMLSDPDPHIRRDAAESLGSLGTPMAIDELLGALDDVDPGVRWRAAEALGSLGDKATPRLIELLASPDGNVRWGAATALGVAQAEDAVVALVPLVHDPDLEAAAAAVGALGNIWGAGTKELITTLDSSDEDVRSTAMERLMALENKDVAGQVLRASLDTKTYYRTLGALRGYKLDAQHLLYAASEHQSSHVRQRAAYMLVQLGSELGVKATVNAMEGQEDSLCRSLAIGLRGQLGERAIASLVAELGRKDKAARYGVAYGLSGYGDAALAPLLGALKSQDADVRAGAAQGLGLLGKKEAAEPLKAAQQDPSEEVRQAVEAALKLLAD